MPEENLGRRMLHETQGLPLGLDSQEAQRIMRQAFTEPTPNAEHNAVSHPEHYTSHPSGIECKDVIGPFPTFVGNAIKYLWRAGLKGDAIEDLRKAMKNIEFEIERLKEIT